MKKKRNFHLILFLLILLLFLPTGKTPYATEENAAATKPEAQNKSATVKQQKTPTETAAGTAWQPGIVPIVPVVPFAPETPVPQVLTGTVTKEPVSPAAQSTAEQTNGNLNAGPTLAAPANEAVLGDGTVLFSWTDVSLAQAFQIQVSKTPQFTSRTIDATTRSTSFQTSSPLALGTYYWRVKKKDAKQNGGEWSDIRTFSIDTLVPRNTTAKNFINGGAAETNSTTVTLAISATKTKSVAGVAGYYISEISRAPKAEDPGWHDTAVTPSFSATVPYTISGGDGMKTVYVWFKDSLARVSASVHGSINLNSTPPHTTITGQPPVVTNTESATFMFSSTKPQSTFQCEIDGKGFEACTSPFMYGGLAEGPHSFTVMSRDTAGNIDPSPATFAWKIDRLAPHAYITSHPRALTRSTSTSFGFDANKPQSMFLCKLDGNAYERCTSPQTYQGLTPGQHTFTVKAMDAAGNTDEQPPMVAWAVDTTPFGTTLTDTPANPANSPTANFSFIADKEDALFECRIDDGEYSACKSPVTYADLAEGNHSFSVRALDDAGVEEETKANFAWEVSLPPVVKSPRHFLNAGSGYLTYKNEVRVAMAAYSSRGVSGYYISEDPTPPESTDPAWVRVPRPQQNFAKEVPFALSNGKGKKVVYVWLKDTAGNVTNAVSDSIYVFNSGYAIALLVLLQLAFIL